MPQTGKGQAEPVSSTATNSTPGNHSPDVSEKEGTADAGGEETGSAGHHSPQENSGTALTGERAGVIPRAVEEMFRFLRQAGVGKGIPATSAGRRRSLYPTSSRDDSRELRNDSPASAAVATLPSVGGGDSPAFIPSTSTASECQSSRSSRSSSSDDLPFAHVPSAAHWPLGEPTVYVRSGSPKDPTSYLASQISPPRDSEKSNDIGTEEDGADKGSSTNSQDVHVVESTARIKYTVECSYMQVRRRVKQST